MARHPEWHAEEEHLLVTLDKVSAEYQFVSRICTEQQAAVDDLRVAAGGSYSNELQVAENLLAITQRACGNLTRAMRKPYFARVDFTPDVGKTMVCYIGKWGVGDHETRMPVVIDWRSAVANLYYTGQVGRAEYPSPEGPVRGELRRKRIFSIEDGTLRSVIEADIISQDEYLNAVLSDHADARLRDIVTTIQAEQNAILRCNPRRPMIVQGVAGAGKTTVALHRITWLLYTCQDTMAPRNLMVLAPNPLFLNYISEVLPELGVEDVIQTTYHGLCERLCGTTLPPVDDSSALLALLSSGEEEKRGIGEVAAFKGSLLYKQCLTRYIDALARRIVPAGGLALGGIPVCSRDEVVGLFTGHLSPFPLASRGRELKKLLRVRLRQARERIESRIEEETRKRANLLREVMPANSPQRQQRMARIYAARDERLAELKALYDAALPAYFKGWPRLNLLERYREFLSEEPLFALPDGVSLRQWRQVCRYSLRALDDGRLRSDDLPALMLLQRAMLGHAERLDIHHTVIDEAQDFSPFMFDMLMDVCHNASFTIVGDLAQGIHSYRGVTDWRETGRVFGPGDCEYFELVTSYRNTVEIMSFAGRVAARHPFPGQKAARPVLRHGAAPRVLKQKGPDASGIAEEVVRLWELGAKTIAVIEKMPDRAAKLHAQLSERLPFPIRLLNDTDTRYEGGVMVLPAHLVKGLEFDAVIIADAGEEVWPDDALHARLLYVCLTRPLHHLTVFYRGRLTPLVEERGGG